MSNNKSAKRRSYAQNRRIKDFQRGVTFGYIANGLSGVVSEEYERSPWMQRMGITKQELANEAIYTLCETLDISPLTQTETKAYDAQMRRIIAIVGEVIRTREGLSQVINKMAKQLSYKERVNLQ